MIHNRERRHTISSTSTRSAALDTAALGFSIFPVTPGGKTPALKGNWQDHATADPGVIEDWFDANPNYNYGVVCGSANDLVVIDLDGPEAVAWWAEQGIPPGAIVTSASGPDHQHHYYFTDESDIQTNKAKLHPHVDVRATGGYVVGPGSMRPTGEYVGDLDNIPNAPAALLDLLPRRTVVTRLALPAVAAPAAPVTAASDSERRQVAAVIRTLEGLPREWSEGAGWRSTMYQMGCWLARMVNSGLYAMTEDAALQILLDHTPTNAAWAEGEILVQWESAKVSADGQVADAPEDSFPTLLPFLTVANLLPDNTSTGEPFSALYMDEPDVKTDGTFAQQRRTLASEALTAGLDDLQTASLVWGAVVGKPLQSAPNGLRTLWAEVTEATPATGHLATVTPIRPLDTDKPLTVDLLTDEERAFVGGYVWFGTRYLDWVGSKPIIVNRPYHRSNRWLPLQRVFGDKGVIYHPVKPTGLGLYHINLGGSSTGKTESFELAEQIIAAYFAGTDERPVLADITKVSPNALHSTLIERDGKTSLVRTDEAQAFFDQVKGNEWQRGLIDDFAKYYEGRVAAKIMSNDKENSNKEADTDLIVHFTGITDLVMQNLELSNWQSGFLLRCVWAIGNPSQPRDRSTEAKTQADLAVVHEVDQMPAQFAAEFRARRADIATFARGDKHVLIFTPEAQSRHLQLANDLDDALSGHPQYTAVLKDYTTRFLVSVNKCAGLVAMSEASEFVELRHELVAIEQAEEWLAAALIVLAKTGNTRFDRQCQDLLAFVTDSPRGTVPAVDVYRKFRPAAHADALLRQLECEQRITRETNTAKTPIVKIRRDEAA